MADDLIKTILEFDINTGDSDKNVKELTNSIDMMNDAIALSKKEIKDLEKENKSLNKAVKDGTKTNEEAAKEIDNNNKKIRELKKANAENSDAIKETNALKREETKLSKIQSGSINELRANVAKLTKERNNINLKTKEGQERYKALTKEIYSQNEAIKRAEEATGDYRRSVGNYQTALKNAGSAIKDFGKNLFSLENIVKGSLIGFVLWGLNKLRQGIQYIIEENKNFHTNLQSLSAITGATGSDLDYFAKTAIETSKTVRASASEIVSAYELVGSQRPELLKDAKALAEVTKNAIILSEATGGKLELVDAAKSLTGVLNQMNMSADQSGRIINVLAAGSKEGAGDVIYLKDAFEKVGTTASLMGLSVEQTTGIIESIAPYFTQASMAGNSFDKVLLKLKEKNIGFKDGVFDMNLAIDQLKKKYDSGTSAADLFGVEHAKLGELLVLNQGKMNDYTDAVTGTNIATEQQTKQNNTLGGTWDKLVNLVTSYFESSSNSEFMIGALNFIKEAVIGLERAFTVLYDGAMATFNGLKLAWLSVQRIIVSGMEFVGLATKEELKAIDKEIVSTVKDIQSHSKKVEDAFLGRNTNITKATALSAEQQKQIEEDKQKAIERLNEEQRKKREALAKRNLKANEDLNKELIEQERFKRDTQQEIELDALKNTIEIYDKRREFAKSNLEFELGIIDKQEKEVKAKTDLTNTEKKAQLEKLNSDRLKLQYEYQKEVNKIGDDELKESDKKAKDKLALEKKINEERFSQAESVRKGEQDRELQAYEESLGKTKEYYEKKRQYAQENYDLELKALQDQKTIIDENEALTEEEKLAKIEELNSKMIELHQGLQDELLGITQETNELSKQSFQDIFNSVQSFGNDIISTIASNNKAEEQRITASYDKRQKALKKNLEDGIISQEYYDEQSEKLEQEKAIALYNVQLSQFKTDRIAKLAQVAIDTATAVSKSISSSPLTFGLPWSAFALAQGSLQAGIIASQPEPSPPTFAEGGGVFSVIGGRSHARGGTKFYGEDGTTFEAEAGEGLFVTKRSATNDALRYLSDLNQSYGGRSFFDEPGRYLADGGQVGINNGFSLNDINAIVERSIATTLENVNIVTKVEDIQTGLTNFNETLNQGKVR